MHLKLSVSLTWIMSIIISDAGNGMSRVTTLYWRDGPIIVQIDNSILQIRKKYSIIIMRYYDLLIYKGSVNFYEETNCYMVR